MAKGLQGEIALVTGASRGIGLAVANELAVCGAIVIGTATTLEGASAITARLRQAGHSGEGCLLDVTQDDSVEQVTTEIRERHGAVSILVNNAGITRDTLLARMKSADWDLVLDTDLKSVYRMSKACLRPMMKARAGRIISITSIVGATGNAGQANYAAAKAGIEGFTRALALEVASRHITVNAVAPGFIETDMTDALDSATRSRLLDRIPLGILGQTRDIAEAVSFLASPNASYITGHTLHVNGGMYMH
ncbi:MAG TPA: 3-oxoacyl-ACP reductase FabG [Gammaproteobacteria bacterium]|nr:3-oxoacyl-ACP reductase FabG [Gammaproteobacteria bacterium]